MSDVLKGMTIAEARALVARMDALCRMAKSHAAWAGATESIDWGNDTPRVGDVAGLVSLAALGAECVQAKRGTVMCGGYVAIAGTVGSTYVGTPMRVLVLPESE